MRMYIKIKYFQDQIKPEPPPHQKKKKKPKKPKKKKKKKQKNPKKTAFFFIGLIRVSRRYPMNLIFRLYGHIISTHALLMYETAVLLKHRVESSPNKYASFN